MFFRIKSRWSEVLQASAKLRSLLEYAPAAERYLGPEEGKSCSKKTEAVGSNMVKTTITPEWVGLLDFKTLLPRTLSA